MAGLILQVDVYVRIAGQIQRNQVGNGGAVELRLDGVDGMGTPAALRAGPHSVEKCGVG